MIQTQTKLIISDNSGGKLAQSIKILGGYKKRYAQIGDPIVVTVKKAKTTTGLNTKTKVKKGSVNKGIVLRTKKPLSRKDGSSIRFFENSILLLNQQEQPVGTRVIGIVPRELKKYKGGVRITSMASGTL
jgi:large subunit ribosomal protein L14